MSFNFIQKNFIFFFIFIGCSSIKQQAHLDRFNDKLNFKEYKIQKQLNINLNKHYKNINVLKKEIISLENKIENIGQNNNNYIDTSFQEYVKNLEYEGMMELISFELEMLKLIKEKEKKLTEVKIKYEGITSNKNKEENIIILLNKRKNNLLLKINTIDLNLERFKSSGRITTLEAEKITLLINESIIYTREGNYSKAILKISDAIELFPSIPILYAQLGSLYFLINNSHLALNNFYKAKQLDPNIDGIEEMIVLLENQHSTQ